MFFLLVLSVSCGIAFLRGGRLRNLRYLPIIHLWLFFIPVMLQLIVFRPEVFRFALSDDAIRVVYLASMLLAAVALWLHRSWPGMRWIISGFILNLIVITLNGGFMPTSNVALDLAGIPPRAARFTNSVPMSGVTILPWLGDVLPLPWFLPIKGVFSVGDVLILIGCVIFTQRALKLPAVLQTMNSP